MNHIHDVKKMVKVIFFVMAFFVTLMIGTGPGTPVKLTRSISYPAHMVNSEGWLVDPHTERRKK